MQAYKPPHNIFIRESIDEELSDDVEDDVFIRDRKSREVRKIFTQTFFLCICCIWIALCFVPTIGKRRKWSQEATHGTASQRQEKTNVPQNKRRGIRTASEKCLLEMLWTIYLCIFRSSCPNFGYIFDRLFVDNIPNHYSAGQGLVQKSRIGCNKQHCAKRWHKFRIQFV